MPESKEEKIIQILTVFSDFTGKKLSPLSQTMFIEILEPYPIEKIEAAATYLLRAHKWTTIPLPANFIEYLDPPEQIQIVANEAWRTVLHAVRMHGYYTTVKFTDAAITQTILAMASSWPEFSNRTCCDDPEFKWLQVEFEKRYSAYAKMPALRNQTLIGWIDGQNGEENPEPVRIGEPERSLVTENRQAVKREMQGEGG